MNKALLFISFLMLSLYSGAQSYPAEREKFVKALQQTVSCKRDLARHEFHQEAAGADVAGTREFPDSYSPRW